MMTTETIIPVVTYPIVYENIHSTLDIESLLKDYYEYQELPDDLDEAIDAAILYSHKKPIKEKKAALKAAQEWINVIETKIGHKIYNQIYQL